MVYCVQGVLTFSTAARRDAVLADVQTRIVGKARWQAEPEQLAATTIENAAGITVEMRFVARADADDLMARIGAFATGARAPSAGSWLRVHDCSHDTDVACGAGTLRTW